MEQTAEIKTAKHFTFIIISRFEITCGGAVVVAQSISQFSLSGTLATGSTNLHD